MRRSIPLSNRVILLILAFATLFSVNQAFSMQEPHTITLKNSALQTHLLIDDYEFNLRFNTNGDIVEIQNLSSSQNNSISIENTIDQSIKVIKENKAWIGIHTTQPVWLKRITLSTQFHLEIRIQSEDDHQAPSTYRFLMSIDSEGNLSSLALNQEYSVWIKNYSYTPFSSSREDEALLHFEIPNLANLFQFNNLQRIFSGRAPVLGDLLYGKKSDEVYKEIYLKIIALMNDGTIPLRLSREEISQAAKEISHFAIQRSQNFKLGLPMIELAATVRGYQLFANRIFKIEIAPHLPESWQNSPEIIDQLVNETTVDFHACIERALNDKRNINAKNTELCLEILKRKAPVMIGKQIIDHQISIELDELDLSPELKEKSRNQTNQNYIACIEDKFINTLPSNYKMKYGMNIIKGCGYRAISETLDLLFKEILTELFEKEKLTNSELEGTSLTEATQIAAHNKVTQCLADHDLLRKDALTRDDGFLKVITLNSEEYIDLLMNQCAKYAKLTVRFDITKETVFSKIKEVIPIINTTRYPNQIVSNLEEELNQCFNKIDVNLTDEKIKRHIEDCLVDRSLSFAGKLLAFRKEVPEYQYWLKFNDKTDLNALSCLKEVQNNWNNNSIEGIENFLDEVISCAERVLIPDLQDELRDSFLNQVEVSLTDKKITPNQALNERNLLNLIFEENKKLVYWLTVGDADITNKENPGKDIDIRDFLLGTGLADLFGEQALHKTEYYQAFSDFVSFNKDEEAQTMQEYSDLINAFIAYFEKSSPSPTIDASDIKEVILNSKFIDRLIFFSLAKELSIAVKPIQAELRLTPDSINTAFSLRSFRNLFGKKNELRQKRVHPRLIKFLTTQNLLSKVKAKLNDEISKVKAKNKKLPVNQQLTETFSDDQIDIAISNLIADLNQDQLTGIEALNQLKRLLVSAIFDKTQLDIEQIKNLILPAISRDVEVPIGELEPGIVFLLTRPLITHELDTASEEEVPRIFGLNIIPLTPDDDQFYLVNVIKKDSGKAVFDALGQLLQIKAMPTTQSVDASIKLELQLKTHLLEAIIATLFEDAILN